LRNIVARSLAVFARHAGHAALAASIARLASAARLKPPALLAEKVHVFQLECGFDLGQHGEVLAGI